jgi:hypothetical protein
VSIPVDDGFVQDRKGLELISIPRHQLAHTTVDSNKRAEAVPLDLEKPIGVGKRLASAGPSGMVWKCGRGAETRYKRKTRALMAMSTA